MGGAIARAGRAVGRAGRAVADAYNSLPWQVKVGIELGVALLEPTAFGEGAFAARWGAKLDWKWLAKYGDDAIRGLGALGRNAKNVAKGAAKAADGVVDDVARAYARSPRGGLCDPTFGRAGRRITEHAARSMIRKGWSGIDELVGAIDSAWDTTKGVQKRTGRSTTWHWTGEFDYVVIIDETNEIWSMSHRPAPVYDKIAAYVRELGLNVRYF